MHSRQIPFDIAIIGAGFSGLGMGIQLKKQGKENIILFERAAEIGGTWRDNIYPGCGCDIPSHLYSYSFAPNPAWSRLYSKQPEILSYLKDTAHKFQIEQKIQYNTEILAAQFHSEKDLWELTDQQGKRYFCKYLISAMGPLNRPVIPDFQGKESFKGESFHSSEWQQDIDLQGKRVAVVGTGASSIQLVPEVAKLAKSLYVFQRTPAWIIPKPDRAVPSREQRLYKRFPFLQRWYRHFQYRFLELQFGLFSGNKFITQMGRKRAQKHLETQIQDPELRKLLAPKYQLGCKRILPSNSFYPTLSKDHVQLVPRAVSKIHPDGLEDVSGHRYPVDVIIFATGFQASEVWDTLNVKGLTGRDLKTDWNQEGPEAYLGTTLSGYPNLFLLIGPNTGLGHNSLIHIMESQYQYILDCIKVSDKRGARYFDVKSEAQKQYNTEIQTRLSQRVWASGCHSWYQTQNGKNTTLWPDNNQQFRKKLSKMQVMDYNWK